MPHRSCGGLRVREQLQSWMVWDRHLRALHTWNVLIGKGVEHMHKLRRRYHVDRERRDNFCGLHCVSQRRLFRRWFERMFELRCRIVPVVGWCLKLRGVQRRDVSRNYRLDRMCRMCCRQIESG